MLKNFKPRIYQETILASAVGKNTLVVLPTGMGKTFTAIMLAAYRLRQYSRSKVLMLAPTRPLVSQHMDTFRKYMDIPKEKMTVFTGFVRPEKRKELWETSSIIFSTPQGMENDIITEKISLKDVSLLIFDEAHRAVKDYSYVWIAQQYCMKARFARILGLTASPGSDEETIKEVVKNLHIENIEVRTEEDPDVKPYIQDVKIEWVKIELPEEFVRIKGLFKKFLDSRFSSLKKIGILQRKNINYVSKTELLKLQAMIQGRIAKGEKTPQLWNGISIVAEIMKVCHALELLQSQGVAPLNSYMEKLRKEYESSSSKAIKRIFEDPDFKSIMFHIGRLNDESLEHPKLDKLRELVIKELKRNPEAKIIIFNQYRDNAINVIEELNKLEGVSARIFVGQMKKGLTGMSQKEQLKALEDFRSGKFNVLTATSVAEEGLDIPLVDLVIFFEPIPSAIRHIQRRGRTGRQSSGKVVILTAKGTIDESYRWSAHHKENRMFRNLISLKSKLGFSIGRTHEKKVSDFKGIDGKIGREKKIIIYADSREKGSWVIKELLNMGAKIDIKALDSADYLLSSRVAVEMKKVDDFVNSIIDGRLLGQLKVLMYSFERPLMIIEGSDDLYSVRNVHPNSIRGMLATITVGYGIPILSTKNAKETASLIYLIAKKEQESGLRPFGLHGSRKPMSIKELQEYIVSALPGVGPALSRPLLKKFRSIKRVFNAKEEQLKKVPKIGPEKAKRIRDVLDREYKD